MTKNELYILCKQVRETLDAFSKDGSLNDIFGSKTAGFPTGCCGPTSDVLAAILYDLTKILPTRVTGSCNLSNRYHNKLKANVHAWLEFDGLTIDLTGDQFNSDDINIPPILFSENHHPLTKFMDIKKEESYIIGGSTKNIRNDFEMLQLKNEIMKKLNNT